MHMDINDENYQGDELGSDSLGNTIVHWAETCEGTEIESDANQLQDKYIEVENLVARGAPIDDLKSRIRELQDLVGQIEKKGK